MDQIHWIGVIIALVVGTWIAFRIVKAAVRVFVIVGVILFLIGFLLLNRASAMSAEVGRFVQHELRAEGLVIPYSVYLPPAYTDSTPLPVVLVLHGAGSAGNDGLRQRDQSIAAAARAHPDRWRAILVLPQCPSGRRWSGAVARAAVMALDSAIARYAIDDRRVYLAGQSMGTDGAFEVASAFTGKFAAFVGVAVGRGDPQHEPRRLATLPIWLFHGTADPIPIARARDRIAAIDRAGSSVARLTELAGRGHEIFDEVYANPAVPAWLLSHHLPSR